jgi:AcrR family transcriptional regulator
MASTQAYDRLLETATRLFHQDGIQAVGVNRIIVEAEVAPMTLYRHFRGKDELVAATLEQWSAHWLSWLNAALDRSGEDPKAPFSALWDALEQWIAKADFVGSFVASAAAELRGQPEHPAQKVISAHRTTERQLLQDLAEVAGARDPTAVAAQLDLLIHGAIAVAGVDRRPDVVAHVRTLANGALDGPLVREAIPEPAGTPRPASPRSASWWRCSAG